MKALRVAGMGRSCDLASRSHDTEVSCSRIHKFSDTLTFLHGSGWNVDCVSVIGYDDEDSDRYWSVM